MHALVVEDEITTRTVLRRILSRELGCDVTECQNGLEALGALASHRFDFVLLDLRMPVLDGVETLEAIRRSTEHAVLPVVIMTVERNEAKVRRVIELGISDYLAKPLRPDNVTNRLRLLMRRIESGEIAPARTKGVSEAAPGRTLIVADADAVFRDRVAGLAPGWRVVGADSGVGALKHAVALTPAAMIVGDGLGLVGRDLLVRKVLANKQLAGLRVALVRSSDEGGAASRPDGVDVMLPRDVDGDILRGWLEPLSADEGPPGAVKAVVDGMTAALSQIFDMMLGLEVELDPSPESFKGPPIGASVRFHLTDAPVDLDFVLRCERATAQALSAVVLEMPATEVSAEDAVLGVAEVVRIAATRATAGLVATGTTLTFSHATPLGAVEITGEQGRVFRTVTGDLRFRVDVVVPTTDAQEPAASALP